MASVDEAYLDMTGTERLHGPALRAAHALHEAMKTETTPELLDRHSGLAPGSQNRLRSGQAQRHPARPARSRSAVSRAPRSAQNPGRRQGDGEESPRDRHSPNRRPGRSRRKDPRIAIRQMGSCAGRQSAGTRRRRLVRRRNRRARRSEIDQPRTHLQRRHKGSPNNWKRLWPTSPKRWDAACASTASTPARFS